MLYVECYPDELLARTLRVTRRTVRHEHGKGNIVNRLRRLQAGTGLMDEDPTGSQPDELRHYQEVERVGNLILLEHATEAGKRVILISPRLEEWLYERAGVHRLSPNDYGLPDSPDRLHSIPRYDQKRSFVEFLNRLRKLDSDMQQLRR